MYVDLVRGDFLPTCPDNSQQEWPDALAKRTLALGLSFSETH